MIILSCATFKYSETASWTKVRPPLLPVAPGPWATSDDYTCAPCLFIAEGDRGPLSLHLRDNSLSASARLLLITSNTHVTNHNTPTHSQNSRLLQTALRFSPHVTGIFTHLRTWMCFLTFSVFLSGWPTFTVMFTPVAAACAGDARRLLINADLWDFF